MLFIPTIVTIKSVWSVTHVSRHLLVKEKRHFLVSLPTSSNQDRGVTKRHGEPCECGDAEKREGTADCKMDRKSDIMTSSS